MPRKRKRGRAEDDRADDAMKPAPAIGTALGSVLKQAGITLAPPKSRGMVPAVTVTKAPARHTPPSQPTPPKAAAEPVRTTAELRMLNDAYEGARPLAPKNARAKPVEERSITARNPEQDAKLSATVRSEEFAARSRLAALVSEGVRFKIRREEDYVEGLRAGASAKILPRLSGRGFSPEATLDLHGLRGLQVDAAIERFIRTHQRRGARHILLIVGKGLHSEDGVSVVAPAAIEALSHGLAAPWVIAFCTAHAVQGGNGALAVLLRD